jgi:large subunit ribosomal protein L10
MGGATGYASTLEGKKKRVETIKGLLESSQMVFTVPASGLTVSETQELRRSLPDGTTMSVVKNSIMKRAIEGTEYEEGAGTFLKGANMWFFIEEDIGGSIKGFNSFVKDNAKQDSHLILGGVLEGNVYDQKGIDAIGKLPSKEELYAKIAGGIKAVPTKLARVIKAPNMKLARAIKLATMPDE